MVAAGDKVDVNLRVEGDGGAVCQMHTPGLSGDNKVLHKLPIELSKKVSHYLLQTP